MSFKHCRAHLSFLVLYHKPIISYYVQQKGKTENCLVLLLKRTFLFKANNDIHVLYSNIYLTHARCYNIPISYFRIRNLGKLWKNSNQKYFQFAVKVTELHFKRENDLIRSQLRAVLSIRFIHYADFPKFSRLTQTNLTKKKVNNYHILLPNNGTFSGYLFLNVKKALRYQIKVSDFQPSAT